MKIIILIIGLLNCNLSYSQTATFIADLSKQPLYKKHSKEINSEYKNEQWIINGISMNYGDTLKLEINPKKLDTIRFRYRHSNSFEEIITNIKYPLIYKFSPNTCCPTFNTDILNDSIKITRAIKVKATEEIKNQILVKYDQNGYLLKDEMLELYPHCKSAMHSNVSKVQIFTVSECVNSENCLELLCQIKSYDFKKTAERNSYNIESKLIEFKYLPLSNEELKIRFNPETDNIKLDTKW